MSKTDWQLSSLKMTVWVQTEDGAIVDTAPVVRRFIGQPLRNLASWMQQQGGFMVDLIKERNHVA